jgi:hypothetical protein
LLPILIVTLMPGDATSASLAPGERICVLCGSRAAADAVLNALLFMPLGWVLGRRKGVLGAMGFGAVLSTVLEVTQLYLVGRFTSVTDVLVNVLGTGFGAWAGVGSRSPLRIAAGLSLVALFAPAVFLKPAPPEGIYYGQWTAVFGDMEAYQGRILDARVGEISVPSWKTPYSGELRESLRNGDAIRVRFEAGPPPPGQAPVFSIFDHRQRGLFMLGADGEDAFVRLWRRGTTARFSTPTWWWRDAFSGVSPGDTIQVVYELGAQGPCLTIQGRVRCLTATTSVGSWSLLAPGGQDGRLHVTLSLIWAFLLGIPLGLLALSRTRKILLVVGIGGMVLGVSRILPYWPTPWLGILFLILGTSLATTLPGLVAPGSAVPILRSPRT